VPLALTLGGFALQLVGVAVTGWGLRLGWRRAATDGDRLLDPVAESVRRWWGRLIDALSGLLRKPRSQSAAVSGVASAAATASARVSRSYPPLAEDLSLDDRIVELDRRSRAIAAEITRAEGHLLDRLEDQRRYHVDLSQSFHRYVDERERTTRQRDLQGIRFQAVGLTLVTLGSIGQALGRLLT
jgi:hypothetical protein